MERAGRRKSAQSDSIATNRRIIILFIYTTFINNAKIINSEGQAFSLSRQSAL